MPQRTARLGVGGSCLASGAVRAVWLAVGLCPVGRPDVDRAPSYCQCRLWLGRIEVGPGSGHHSDGVSSQVRSSPSPVQCVCAVPQLPFCWPAGGWVRACVRPSAGRACVRTWAVCCPLQRTRIRWRGAVCPWCAGPHPFPRADVVAQMVMPSPKGTNLALPRPACVGVCRVKPQLCV